jgi:putative MATE family efflux protein
MKSMFKQTVDDRVFYSKLFTIAMPIIIQNFIMSSLNLVDVMMIGQVGDVAVASVGLANQIYFLLRLLLFGICSGSSVFAAQFWGIREIPKIKKVLGLSLLLSIGAGSIFTVLAIFFPAWILGLYTEDLQVIQQGAVYLRIVGISYIATAISFAYSSVLRSVEEVNLPMLMSVIALVLNIILNYGLILGKLGMPQLGIQGAAIGTTVARSVEFILLLVLTYRRGTPAAAKLHEMWGYSREFLRSFFKTTGPVIFNELLWSLGCTMYYVIYAHMNTASLAAANIASTVQSMGFVFLIGIASGCAILVGNQIGASYEDTAYIYAKKSMQVNVIFGIILGFILHFAAPYILKLYLVSDETAYLATRMIQMQGYSFWIKSIGMILIVGIMRSGGDTQYSMLLDVGCIWLVGLPLGALAAFVFHLPAYWVTLIFVSEDVVKSAVGLNRFVSRKWINNLASVPLPNNSNPS